MMHRGNEKGNEKGLKKKENKEKLTSKADDEHRHEKGSQGLGHHQTDPKAQPRQRRCRGTSVSAPIRYTGPRRELAKPPSTYRGGENDTKTSKKNKKTPRGRDKPPVTPRTSVIILHAARVESPTGGRIPTERARRPSLKAFLRE